MYFESEEKYDFRGWQLTTFFSLFLSIVLLVVLISTTAFQSSDRLHGEEKAAQCVIIFKSPDNSTMGYQPIGIPTKNVVYTLKVTPFGLSHIGKVGDTVSYSTIEEIID